MYQKLIALFLLCSLPLSTQALEIQSQSALLMEQSTGNILFEQDAHTQLPPASVTKIMTILLTMEALDKGLVTQNEIVIVSTNAASMGGSQVYLKEGETMELWELLKCVVVVSGNDASVALAEHLSGSEENFVALMNEKAQSLGMTNTLFQNCTGLPAEDHYTSAYDIALMSQDLMKHHPKIQELTTIWMDSIRNGSFGLSNTNRLIHSYSGATGLKTGSTDEALYCLSATASRDNLDLIVVLLKGPTSDQRFADATALLDYGFQNYLLQEIYPSSPPSPIPITLGSQGFLQAQIPTTTLLLHQSQRDQVTSQINLPTNLEAPLSKDQQIGSFDVYLGDSLAQSTPILSPVDIPRQSLMEIFTSLWKLLVMA